METRVIRELSILLPSIDEDDLVEAVEVEAEELRYRRVGSADWSRLVVEGVSLVGCWFTGTSLRHSVWEDVTISGALFERVDLSSARLEGIKLDRTHFVGCQLSGLSLTEAAIGNTIFESCRLDYATFHTVRTTGPLAFINCTHSPKRT